MICPPLRPCAEQKSSPKFIQEIREVRIKEGMKARFEAIFAGNPRPNIAWLFNGEEIQGRMRWSRGSMQTHSMVWEVA